MFRRYSFDMKTALKKSVLRSGSGSGSGNSTEISVSFESPISFSERKFSEQQNEHHVVPPVCQYDGVCHANHIRKMQASFR